MKILIIGLLVIWAIAVVIVLGALFNAWLWGSDDDDQEEE